MSDYNVIKHEKSPDVDHLPYWDVVVIGAGPAGLAASLTTAHRGLTTLVIEAKDLPGGQPGFLYPDKELVDIPGFPDGITGEELGSRTYRQAVDALVQFRLAEELVTIEDTTRLEKDLLKRVVTNKGSYLCRKAILACGLLHYPRRFPVLDRHNSPLVHYRMPRLDSYQGKRVVVVGGGDSALDTALMVLGRGGQVDVIVRGQTLAGRADALTRVLAAGGGRPHLDRGRRRGSGGRPDPRVARQRRDSFRSRCDRPDRLCGRKRNLPTAGHPFWSASSSPRFGRWRRVPSLIRKLSLICRGPRARRR